MSFSRTSLLLLVGVLVSGCGNRCENWWWGGGYAEIGIGTKAFIDVPPGAQVSPEQADPPYFNLAIRTSGMSHEDLDIRIEAWVGDDRFAGQTFEDVDMQCRRWGQHDVGGLKFFLDPALLPPQTGPVVNPSPPNDEPIFVDTGWDSGWDSGRYYEPPPRGDVRLTAELTDDFGNIAYGETVWFIYR